MKHTPGPWHYDERKGEVYAYDENGHEDPIAHDIGNDDDGELLAKAPEIYDIIQRYRSALEECAMELDHYYTAEYPSDHPGHVRKRMYLHETNIARNVLEETKDFLLDM